MIWNCCCLDFDMLQSVLNSINAINVNDPNIFSRHFLGTGDGEEGCSLTSRDARIGWKEAYSIKTLMKRVKQAMASSLTAHS